MPGVGMQWANIQSWENHLVAIQTESRPFSLNFLAHVLHKCEEHDRPVHLEFLRWATTLSPTRDDPQAQTNTPSMRNLVPHRLSIVW